MTRAPSADAGSKLADDCTQSAASGADGDVVQLADTCTMGKERSSQTERNLTTVKVETRATANITAATTTIIFHPAPCGKEPGHHGEESCRHVDGVRPAVVS